MTTAIFKSNPSIKDDLSDDFLGLAATSIRNKDAAAQALQKIESALLKIAAAKSNHKLG
jgi:hypothetical protein